MVYYAQLNDKNIVCGISQLTGHIQQDNLIKIDTYDESLLGKQYKDGTFVEPVIAPADMYEIKKQEFLGLIKEAQLLGDEEEVQKLQKEWQKIKKMFV